MRLLLAVALVCLLPGLAFGAQSVDATIGGVVRDTTGAVLPGVLLTLTNADRGTTASEAMSSSDGTYIITALPPGNYRLAAQLSGFSPETIDRLPLHIADRLRVDITLNVASPAETVLVAGRPAAERGRDVGALSETIAADHIRQLPLFSRNPTNLIQLVGGVSGGADADGNLATAQISINGSRTANTEVTIDGVSTMVGSTGDVTFIPSVEALREFKVQTSAYAPEYGRTSGATVAAVVQSGTSHYRGSLYGYLRDETFNANNYFNNSRGIAKPADNYRQFGGSLGGPLKPGATTFFFANYEALRRTLPRQFTATLPTDALRTGDLSVFATPILDPRTGLQVRDPSRASAGNPLGLNIIPVNRIDPAAAAIIANLPLPNQPGLSDNFVTVSADRVRLNQFTGHLEHNFGGNRRLAGRYSQQTGVNPAFTPDASDIIPGVLNPGTGANHPVDRQLAITYTDVARTSLVLEGSLGVNVNRQTIDPPGVLDSAGALGFARMPQLVVDGNSGYYAPAIQFPGFTWGYRAGTSATSQFGMNANTLRRQDTVTLQPSFAATWITGGHTIKSGVQLRTNALDIFNGGAAFAGVYTVNGDMLPGAPANSQASQWAAFLFGLVDSAQYTIPQPETIRRNVNVGLFMQDDWRWSDRLTFNLGLRWEYESPLTVDDDIYSRVDPNTGALIVAGANGNSALNLDAPTLNFGPRAGVVWSLTDRTIVRGAYGLFYSQLFSNLGGSGALFPGFTTTVQYPRLGPGQPQAFALGDGMPLTGQPGIDDPFAAERKASITQPLAFGAGWASISPLPHMQLWNLGVERALGWNVRVEAAYVGSHGSHLPLDSFDFNAVPFEDWDAVARAGSAAAIQAVRPFPTVGTLNEFANLGRSNYRSAQFHVRRPSTAGIGFQASYTLSRSEDDGSGLFNFSQPNGLQRGLIPTYDRSLDYGPSAFDRPQVLSGAVSWEPLSPRGPSGSSTMRAIFGGFQLNALVTAQSGLPATIVETGIGSLPLSNPRPDQQGLLTPDLRPGPNGTVRYFPAPGDPDFPFTPVGPLYTGTGATRTQILPVGVGTVGRNSVRGPSTWTVDMSIVRRVPVAGANVNVRVEAFNLFNHTNFLLDPAGATTTLPVQVVNGQAQFVAPAFGLITSSLPARRLQLALRLDF